MINRTKVVLVDDHNLVRKGIAELLMKEGYAILLECNTGKELINKLEKNTLPDIVLMDINMPEMDGYETTLWLKNNYPLVNVLAVSMHDDDIAIIRMLKNGAKGYIEKNATPEELRAAIDSIMTRGFHYSEAVTGRLLHSIQKIDENEQHPREVLNLREKEIEFLKYASRDITLKEVAALMKLSPRTIDGIRDKLLEKLNVYSRIGLVLFAVKNRIVHFN